MLQPVEFYGATAVAVAFSFLVSVLIVMTQGWHGKHSLDSDLTAVQKFHKTPVPRIGGAALLAGLLCAAFFLFSNARPQEGTGVLLLLVAGLPAFLAGFVEDLTKSMSVRLRLQATLISALLAGGLLGAWLNRLDVWGLDSMLAGFPLLAAVVTAVAVAGVANAVNIIDGFHGLAGSAVVIMLAGLGVLAWNSHDSFVAMLAVAGIGATVGFLLVNYPTGRLFMGDGGAYLAGFWVAEVGILLVIRNPEISTWQVLAICSYPVIEVLFSMYRKAVVRDTSPSEPDRLHMHMLIYRRLVWKYVSRNEARPWMRSAAVTCVIASWIGVMTFVAVKFGADAESALLVVALNLALYLAVYARLVRGHWRLQTLQRLKLMFVSRPGVLR